MGARVQSVPSSYKDAVRAATTANITLSGTQTVDGVALNVGDRILVKNQTTGSQNGFYEVASGAWANSADGFDSSQVRPGHKVVVTEGTVNADTEWMNTNTSITLGTTALTYIQIHPKIFRTVHTFAIQGSVTAVTVPPVFVSISGSPSTQKVNMVKVRYVIQSGTSITFWLQKNGAAFTNSYGTSGAPLTANTTAAETVATNALADNDLITLVLVTPTGSPANLTVTCVFEHTV